jgi:YggT family protein
MFVIANFLSALASLLDILLSIFMWVIIARAILSWVNPDPYNPIVRFIHNLTEPVLYRIRRIIPGGFGGIDISPIVVFLCILFLQKFVVQSLKMLAMRLM